MEEKKTQKNPSPNVKAVKNAPKPESINKIEPVEVKVEPIVEVKHELRIVNTQLNLREAPNMMAAIKYVMPAGKQLEVLEDLGDWIKVEDGYCMKQYTREIKE